jgi:hypothetical protein
MQPPIPAPLFALLLLAGMLLVLEAGRRVGLSRRATESADERSGLGAVEGAVFALFGLLMAFTFSGAASRFSEKRMLIAEEVNDVGTAYLRIDLVPEEAQPALRDLFRQYVDSRLATYRKLPDMAAARVEMARSRKLGGEIWARAVAATRVQGSYPGAGRLLLPALNSMLDIATTRTMALQAHPPGFIYVLLFGLGLVCSLLAGYRMAMGPLRSWIHILGFTVITVVVVYVTLDMEYPRTGLFHLESADQLLVEAREGMK